MAIYIVQCRGDDEAALERATFIRDGFSWPAAVFGPVWLLCHRLWLPLGIWIAIEVAYLFLVFPHVPLAVSVALDGLAHLFIGTEGQRLRQQRDARLAKRTDVVEGRNRDEAEVLFFRRERPSGAT